VLHTRSFADNRDPSADVSIGRAVTVSRRRVSGGVEGVAKPLLAIAAANTPGDLATNESLSA